MKDLRNLKDLKIHDNAHSQTPFRQVRTAPTPAQINQRRIVVKVHDAAEESLFVSVRVSVCVRERERERERGSAVCQAKGASPWLLWSVPTWKSEPFVQYEYFIIQTAPPPPNAPQPKGC